jgi:S-adenosylmethionine:tRNA ribosyltransferase-isomerase
VRLADVDYVLPPERIAQVPIEPRDAARLLCVPRGGALTHRVFSELPDLLAPGDLLVVNETRVSAVRLFGAKQTGATIEALLMRPALEHGDGAYEALVRPARRLRSGDRVAFPDAGLDAEIVALTADGGRVLRFSGDPIAVSVQLEAVGTVPLPPYITTPLGQKARYQTVYAKTPGSAAAPTAGLHFTDTLLQRLREKGVDIAPLRLDVGLGTFRPIQTDDITQHVMHAETFAVPPDTAAAVNACRGRVIAVGTTSLRALESAAEHAEAGERVGACDGATNLFVTPGYRFRAVDGLITNFHQPHSTLLLLVAAFIGVERMRAVYAAALSEHYRFLSFGDAMFAV